jgi:tetratricopeptide (TPR) repeat protein
MLAESDAPKPAPKPQAAPVSTLVSRTSPYAVNVPAFLTRNTTSLLPATVQENGSHNGGQNGSGNGNHNGNGNGSQPTNHKSTSGNGAAALTEPTPAVQEKEYTFQVAAVPSLEVPRRAGITNPHKVLRTLARNVQADVRSAILANDLDKQIEHLLFISTPDDMADLLQDASLLVELGMNALAERIFLRITEMEPTRSEGWLGCARVTTDPMRRVSYLQKAIYLSPTRELRGELALARQALQEHAYALLEEGTSQSNPQRMAEAHALFKQATTIDPTDERAWLGCARTADNLVEKMSYLEQARRLNPQSKQVRDLYTILGSFVHDEPKERWTLAKAKKAPWVLGILLLAAVAVFFALPWILPPR